MRNGTAVGSRAPILFNSPEIVTAGLLCVKRDGSEVAFDCNKIRKAVANCFSTTYYDGLGVPPDAVPIIEDITRGAVAAIKSHQDDRLGVEQVQRYVIQQLWIKGLFPAAEHYQNYRESHRKVRELETATLFLERVAFKPFDYADAEKFKRAIQNSPWLDTEFDFTSDVQDYRVHLVPCERSAISRTALAISQIEVKMKRFWAKLGDRIQKPEIEQVGVVFGANEVVHADAYSSILDALGLNNAFKGLPEVPAIRRRIDYLNRAMRQGADGSDRSFAKTLATFALLVENVSLFSQFVIVKSFSKKARKQLENIDNVVQATMKEEQVHAQFGTWLINIIKTERPEWFGKAFYGDLADTCREAYDAECGILDWIFEEGSIQSVSRAALGEFLKKRINEGVVGIGGDPVFDVDRSTLAEVAWFDEELAAPIDVDFFHKKPTNYSFGDKPMAVADMWD